MGCDSCVIHQLRDKIDKLASNTPIKCWDCFECCTFIKLSRYEKDRMLKLLKKKWIKEPPKWKWDDYCEFLDTDWKCSVYEERPLICRAFGHTKDLKCSYHGSCAVHEMPEWFKEYRVDKKLIFNKATERLIKKMWWRDKKDLITSMESYFTKEKML